MPRTIESIVENHTEARRRTAAGLPVWARTVDIKKILHAHDGEKPTNDLAAKVANLIAARLKASLPAALWDYASPTSDNDLADIVEGMTDLRPDSYADDPSYSALEDFNNMLDGLYDWADRERVWLG